MNNSEIDNLAILLNAKMEHAGQYTRSHQTSHISRKRQIVVMIAIITVVFVVVGVASTTLHRVDKLVD